MTKEKQEHLILQIKYAFLALIVGICVGIVDTIFGRGLLAISAFRTAHYQYLLPFLPLAGLLIIWLYQHFSSLSLKGMTLIFETGQKKREEIPLALVPLVMIGTWITHLFGGSAGREGVAVQITLFSGSVKFTSHSLITSSNASFFGFKITRPCKIPDTIL